MSRSATLWSMQYCVRRSSGGASVCAQRRRPSPSSRNGLEQVMG